MATSVADAISSFRFRKDPLQKGLDSIVLTGRMPGAPVAHRRLADYIEYAIAIVNSTTTVAEAITAQDLIYFAWGLQSLECQPKEDAVIGHYHVDATFHTGKLLLIAASNPRSIEWLYMIAIMVQRGLRQQVIKMILERKDRFLASMQEDLPDASAASMQALVAYSANLQRLVVNVVCSLESLDLGELGGQLSLEDDLPNLLDFEHYVTPYKTISDIVETAERLGCIFHEKPLYVEPDSSLCTSGKQTTSTTTVTSAGGMSREIRIGALRAEAGTIRYQIINNGPTGRFSHGRLISGLLRYARACFTEAQAGVLYKVLKQPSTVRFGVETDLRSGISDLNTAGASVLLECPGVDEDSLPTPADIRRLDIFINDDESDLRNISFLDFQNVVSTSHTNMDSVKQIVLIVKGWLWAAALIRDFPDKIYISKHTNFFRVLTLIGLVMMHLEQGSGVEVTSNNIFYALSLLTNSGGLSDSETSEAMIYAAQGPAGTLIQDIFNPDVSGRWCRNSQLTYRWLRGKFIGVPETAHFSSCPTFRQPSIITGEVDLPNTVSVSIFADSTEGHTLSCSFVNARRQIKTLPYPRLIIGLMTAKIGWDSCTHDFVSDCEVTRIPWSIIQQCYGIAELPEEQTFAVTDAEGSRILQGLALGVTVEGTAIQVNQCLRCALMSSNHVLIVGMSSELSET